MIYLPLSGPPCCAKTIILFIQKELSLPPLELSKYGRGYLNHVSSRMCRRSLDAPPSRTSLFFFQVVAMFPSRFWGPKRSFQPSILEPSRCSSPPEENRCSLAPSIRYGCLLLIFSAPTAHFFSHFFPLRMDESLPLLLVFSLTTRSFTRSLS